MKKYFVTLDLGTSMIKGMIWDSSGHCHYHYFQHSPSLQLNGFFAEQDIKEFSKKIISTLRQLHKVVSFKQCACLAISTQRDTLIAMHDDNELTYLVSWLDRRGLHVNGDRFDWLREKFKSFRQINHIRSLMSWLCEKLTGIACETASTAPHEWLSSRSKFSAIKGPQLVPPGTILHAKPTLSYLRRMIPDGLPIVIGAGDKDCSLLAGQSYLPSRAVLCAGTAISLGKLVKTKTPLPKSNQAYFSPTEFMGYLPIEAGLPYGGGLLSWLSAMYGIDVHSLEHCLLPDVRSPIFCLPSFFTNHLNKNVFPKFIGIEQETNQKILLAAAIEGIILELINCKSILENVGEFINEVVVGGNNRLLIQHASWLASALQCHVKLIKNSELTSLGLAMTAMTVIEKNQDYFSAAKKILLDEINSFDPNPSAVLHWNKRFQKYILYKNMYRE